MSTKETEKHYLNNNKISKQTYNKYLMWEKVIRSIIRGANERFAQKELYGESITGVINALLKEKYVVSIGRGNHSYYDVTDKGLELIDNIKNNLRKEQK